MKHPEIITIEQVANLMLTVGCPTIAFSNDVSESNLIRAYQVGIDALLENSVSCDLVRAKIQFILKNEKMEESNSLIKFGRYYLDANRSQVSIEDKTVTLSRKEMEILQLLINADGKPLAVYDIIEQAWRGQSTHPSAVAVYIQRLRRKLNLIPGEPSIIVNIHGRGYSINQAGTS